MDMYVSQQPIVELKTRAPVERSNYHTYWQSYVAAAKYTVFRNFFDSLYPT